MLLKRKYGLFRGRFQPFHNGHLERCKYILSRHQILVIALVVVKPNVTVQTVQPWVAPAAKLSVVDSFRKDKNPFSYIDTFNMIMGSLHEVGIDFERIRIIPHFTPLIYPSEMEFLFTPPQKDTILYIAPRGEHNIFGIDYYAKRGWKIKVPPKINFNYSASDIRTRIRNNENLNGMVTLFTLNYLKSIL